MERQYRIGFDVARTESERQETRHFLCFARRIEGDARKLKRACLRSATWRQPCGDRFA